MAEPTHYHKRIQRATERLAQLQARELLATQRREAKFKEIAKRNELKRRQRVADMVFLAGVHELDDAELVGALLIHARRRRVQEVQTEASMLGNVKIESSGRPPTAGAAH